VVLQVPACGMVAPSDHFVFLSRIYDLFAKCVKYRQTLVMTQTLTPHQITVTILKNMVISAVIDGKWDELNQQTLEN
jgi:hypothetical protein